MKIAYIPYYGNLSNIIDCILKKGNIKQVHLLPKKIKNMLCPIKDNLGLKKAGVYKILCEYTAAYTLDRWVELSPNALKNIRGVIDLYPDMSHVPQHSLDDRLPF